MNANPPSLTGSSPMSGARFDGLASSGRAELGRAPASAMITRWSALHDAAAIVATLAGIAAEPHRPEQRNFPALMRDAGGWRYALAEQGVDDLTAMMAPGLKALLAIHARGADCAPAALALWQEFHVARAALLALAPPAAQPKPPAAA